MSCNTTTAPNVSPARTAATVAAKKCWRSVPVTISASTRGSPASTRRTASINSVCRTTSTSALPDFGGTSSSRMCGETLIGENQPLRRVHHRDAFHHAAQNRRRQIALFGQRANRSVHSRRCLIQRAAQFFQLIA